MAWSPVKIVKCLRHNALDHFSPCNLYIFKQVGNKMRKIQYHLRYSYYS